MDKMFCFQCEQTAGCSGCKASAGVCGKKSSTANLQDELTGALIGLSKSLCPKCINDKTDKIMLEGLFTTVTNVNFNDETIQELIDKVNDLKLEITKNNNTTPCENYDVTNTLEHKRGYSFFKIPYSFWYKRNGGLCLPCNGSWLQRKRSNRLYI